MTSSPFDPIKAIPTALLEASGLPADGLWQQIVDTMHEGLLLVDPDRRILYMNRRAEEIVGRGLGEACGALCVDAINCPQCRCTCRLFEEGRADDVEVTIYSQADERCQVLRKNGRVLKDADGRILGGVETFTDITREVEQRQQNERYTAMLFHEKSRVDALLDAMDEGVLAVNAGFTVLTCAPRAAELLGLAPEEDTAGKTLPSLLGVEPGFFGTDQATDLNGRTFQVELHGEGGDPVRGELSFRRVRLSDDEMLCILRATAAPPRRRGEAEHRFHGIVSRAPRMWEIFRLLESAAQTQSSILIEGESGVGKELVARAIHQLSPRRDQPFYAVNCATFTGSLLLSELFGHERGSFTGAYRTTPGKLELAGGGTLFLDEVSEIPLPYQAVLLRVLEERRFERVGGRQPIPLRARIIAATNVCLSEAVQARTFRDDLFFRIKVVPITVPPLRERREDIGLLANYFASHPAVNLSGRPLRFAPETLAALEAYPWPGNVRELRNLVEYLCFVAKEEVLPEHLPVEIREGRSVTARPAVPPGADPNLAPATSPTAPRFASPPDRPVAAAGERETLLAALEQARYRRAEAARLLGIDRTTLWRRMKKHGIS